MDRYDRMESLAGKQIQLAGIAEMQDARAATLDAAGDREGAAWQRHMAATNRRYSAAGGGTLERHMRDSVARGDL